MRFRSTLSAAVLVFLSISTASSQVTVVVPKELKRTAHRLRIPVERLQNIRTALRETTALVSGIDPSSAGALGGIALGWVQFNRPEAKANLESIYRELRTAGVNAEDVRAYQGASQAAQAVASAYAELDFDRSQEMIRTWPAPPARLGDSATAIQRQMESNSQRQALNFLAMRDPERAAALLAAGQDADWMTRSNIARQLTAQGKKDQASTVLDQTLRDLAASTPDPRKGHEYGQILQQAAAIDPSRAREAAGALARSAAALNQGPGGQLTIGTRTIDLTPGEAMLTSILQANGRIDMASNLLAQSPELKAKLDRVGGVDAFLRHDEPVRFSFTGGAGYTARPAPGMPPPPGAYSDQPPQDFTEVRALANRDPAAARRKILDAARDPAAFNSLIQLAHQLNQQDPDLASSALEAARALLPRIASVGQRAAMLQNLVRTYRMVEGEVDPGLLKEGFVLADDLRQELAKQFPIPQAGIAPGGPVPGPVSWTTPADRLESALIAELARENFSNALSYVRSLPDARFKLMALNEIVNNLRAPF